MIPVEAKKVSSQKMADSQAFANGSNTVGSWCRICSPMSRCASDSCVSSAQPACNRQVVMRDASPTGTCEVKGLWGNSIESMRPGCVRVRLVDSDIYTSKRSKMQDRTEEGLRLLTVLTSQLWPEE